MPIRTHHARITMLHMHWCMLQCSAGRISGHVDGAVGCVSAVLGCVMCCWTAFRSQFNVACLCSCSPTRHTHTPLHADWEVHSPEEVQPPLRWLRWWALVGQDPDGCTPSAVWEASVILQIKCKQGLGVLWAGSVCVLGSLGACQ